MEALSKIQRSKDLEHHVDSSLLLLVTGWFGILMSMLVLIMWDSSYSHLTFVNLGLG